MVQNYTIASAPGKVLLTGGYLVLDQAFSGLVVSTSARFYTAIRPGQASTGHIEVHSPQFDQASWSYSATATKDRLAFSALPSDSRNKFVETCLFFSLTLLLEKLGEQQFNACLENGLAITIVGDNDFYSQRAQLQAKQLPNDAASLESLDPFCQTHATLQTVHKTGLGSSAALITSLVAALFLHFGGVNSVQNDKDRLLIHNVAQFVHCFAQGKVGSGFDVSSAVWGSHHYRRFNPAILSPVMEEHVEPKLLLDTLAYDNKSWDNNVVHFKLPFGFELMLADIDAGSHTPTLVGKVLAWRKAQPEEADALWGELGERNSKVEQHFRDLESTHTDDPATYEDAIRQCAQLKASQWSSINSQNSVVQKMVALVNDFGRVRELLRKMSRLSGVPIEPEEQTRLLDACMEVEGTIMAGVPGAGGYDAIFCIVLSDVAKRNVRRVWAEWAELSTGPLLAKEDSNGVTSVASDSVRGLLSTLV
ncbi:phosphomevalonate kinase [Apophysomyces sp. BC1034]|nr:phosphomevalonate kinase [Apophysomyces sp. BC1015]KAG0168525.1 phosphomevalonate kinase [Apophysomyces sp. BC1021]KAG0184186.1 phosphomevalonate kinase [Apophysomyces sp. BC1034]